MNTSKIRLFTMIAVLPLFFMMGSVKAASLPQQDISPVGHITNVDAKATVLAKGQNHLPKRAYDKVVC